MVQLKESKMADEVSKSGTAKRTHGEESDEESASESSMSHSEDDDSSSLSGSEEEMDSQNLEEIQVDFEAFSPSEKSFDGIRSLLQQLFLKSAVDLSKLAKLIISQPEITSIIKVVNDDDDDDDDDDDGDRGDNDDANNGSEADNEDCDIFGVMTVLNLKQYKEEPCIQQIQKLLLDKCHECADKQTQKKFEEFLNDEKMLGFLINERFINIPPQIVLPLFKTLRSELEIAQRSQKGKQSRLDYFLMLCKSYKAAETKQSKSKKSKRSRTDDDDLDELQFSNIEDQFFIKESVLSFSYPSSDDDNETIIAGKWSYDDATLKPYRTVLVVPYSKIHPVMAALDEVLHQ